MIARFPSSVFLHKRKEVAFGESSEGFANPLIREEDLRFVSNWL